MNWPRLTLADSKPRADTTVRGDSAVGYRGQTGVDERRMRELDYSYEWTESNKWRLVDRMRFSDPKIAGLRDAQNLPLLRASATIAPEDAKSTGAVEKANFVSDCLLENFPWRAFLADVCLHLDFGFAPFEICWRLDDGRVHLGRLALRPPSSILTSNIYVKDGAVSRIVQTPSTGGTYEIPGEKLIWFAHDKEGDAFTGRSILRAMHKPWYTKERLEILLPILGEKMGGVPVFTEPAGGLDEAMRAKLDAMGDAFALGERMYIRKPEGVGFELIASNVRAQDLLEAIRYFDSQLTARCQAQYLDLGVNQAGSRALGTTLADQFSDSVQAQANYIEDVVNAEGGLIHQMVAYNFPSDDELPKLRFGNVQRSDIKALAAALKDLIDTELLVPDETLAEFVRGELNLPESTSAQVQVPGTQPSAVAPSPAPAAPSAGKAPTGEAPDETGAQASEHGHPHGLRLAEPRQPRGIETCLDLAELSARFTDAKTAIREATQATREALIRELASRATAAQTKGNLAQFVAGAPPMVDKLAAEIAPLLAEFYAAGAAQVADEMERQRTGLQAAEKKPKKPLRLDPKDLEAKAEVVARSLAQTTQAAVAAQVMRSETVAVSTAVVADMALRASDAAALQMSAVVTDLMQAGRAAQAAAVRADIELATYSAILDENVCDTCAEMDGSESTDLGESEDWTPNPDCDGGDRCRCVCIFTLRQEPAGPTLAELTLAEIVKLAERPIPAPVVNVAAPPAPVVNVAAPVVNVAAAEAPVVTVNVPEPKPRRVKRETQFTKDAAGLITGKSETETEE